jgi:hypothetical protein
MAFFVIFLLAKNLAIDPLQQFLCGKNLAVDPLRQQLISAVVGCETRCSSVAEPSMADGPRRKARRRKAYTSPVEALASL